MEPQHAQREQLFDPAIERALRAASEAHAGVTRKGGESVPYVLHPVHVALILARLGEPSIVIQAAILHDVVEDCADWSIARVEREFGGDVAAIVAEVTEDKSKSWDERKRHQIDVVPHLSAAALAVKAADKLHNIATLTSDLRSAADPKAVWARFNGGRDRTLTMARGLVDAITARLSGPMADELRVALRTLEQAALPLRQSTGSE